MVRPPVSDAICLRCKGARLLCGKPRCPVLMKSSIMKRVVPFDYTKVERNKTVFGASPPAVFVGRFGYPNVSMGPMIPIDDNFLRPVDADIPVGDHLKDTSILDISEEWFGKQMEDIVSYRSSLVRSNFKINVNKGTNDPSPKLMDDMRERMSLGERRLLDASQELAMSKKSVDTEATLDKFRINLTYDVHSPPLGPIGQTEKIKIIDNIKVHPKVDYVVGDTDLKAEQAISEYLYPTNLSGNDVKDPRLSTVVTGTEMHRLLSAGLLGKGNKRKIVPTRWSITAVDSIISKNLARQIKYFPEINSYITFHDKFLDNNFIILLMPGPWSYEMMEVWNADTIWTQTIPGVQTIAKTADPMIVEDYEMEQGRKNYASNITGAYYAARKEVTEFLYRNHRQARCIVFREVSGGYIVPLGVWVIRETVRNALSYGFNGPEVKIYDNLQSALGRIKEEFNIPLVYWLRTSNFLKNLRKQRRLDEWLKLSPNKI